MGTQIDVKDAASSSIEVIHSSVNGNTAILGDNAKFPDFVVDVLNEISTSDLRDQLKSFLLKNSDDLAQYQSGYIGALTELNDTKDRLGKVEVELGDVRSAVALMVAGQDDALSVLQRRYNEELASLQSISQEQMASQATDHRLLEQERAHWYKERNTLLAYVNAHQTEQPVRHSNAFSCSNEDLRIISTDNLSISKETQTIQSSSTNESRETVSTTVIPVGCVDHSGHAMNNQVSSTQEFNPIIERYENEISRLRRMLEDCRMQNDPGFTDEEMTNSTIETAVNSASAPPMVDELCLSQTADSLVGEALPLSFSVSHDIQSPVMKLAVIDPQCRERHISLYSSNPCAMCDNYEQLLQKTQLSEKQKTENLVVLTKELSLKSSALEDALQLQAELEAALKTLSLTQGERIKHVEEMIDGIFGRVESISTNYHSHRQFTERELEQLTNQCQTLQSDFDLLQSHYDALLGRRSKSVAELIDQPIQLPDDKTELELFALRLREENLCLREAREHLDDRVQTDMQLHEQLLMAERQKATNEKDVLHRELDEVNARLASLTDIVHQRDNEAAARGQLEQELLSLKAEIEKLQSKLSAAENDAADARAEVTKLQQRLVCLQTDLDNVESVQADFVRLSQSLQIQLEQFRQQEHEVRWIDPVDVTECFACHTPFPSGSAGANRKVNCRHCGKVYCANCLKHTVPSGPTGRAARVCDVCHTLLNKNVAPYFSTGFHASACSPNESPRWRRHSSGVQRSYSPNTTTGCDRTADVTNRVP